MSFIFDSSKQVQRLKDEIKLADAILIGAGAGLSTAAGLKYDGRRFYDHFADFAQAYGLQDMYSAGFYPYETLEEYWAYWSRHILLNRYQPEIGTPYHDLLQLVQDKHYFILTTNVDHCFQKAGFDKQHLFYTQGDYGLWQCSKPCCQVTYDNYDTVKQMVKQQKNRKIPSDLIPYCPHCGAPMTMNLRINQNFVQDAGWYHAAAGYQAFLSKYARQHILFLELGVGFHTPSIIKYPFWQMTAQNPNARYACLNAQDCQYPSDIASQTICIQEDLAKTLHDLIA